MDRLYHLEQLLEGSDLASPSQCGPPELAAPGRDRPFGEHHQQTLPVGYSNHTGPGPGYNSILQEQGLIRSASIQNDELPVDLSGQFSHQHATIEEGQNQPVAANQRAAYPPPIPQFTTTSIPSYSNERAHPPLSTGGSYQGAPRSRTTLVTRSTNCCLFLKGLPATISVREFVHQLQTHRVGKLAAIHINPPDSGHRTAAAKITMWSREGAERLYDAITSQQISFERHALQVYWNRNRVGLQTARNGSRVILVIGRPEHVRPGVMLP
ncbi:hypothetical protein PG987_015603 [Apiospora arundinis]